MSAPKFVSIESDDEDCPDAKAIVAASIKLANKYKVKILDEASEMFDDHGLKSSMVLMMTSMLLEDCIMKIAKQRGGVVLEGWAHLRRLVDESNYKIGPSE